MRGKAVLSGTHFMNGDEACAEGGLAAGCTFFAGYPITPATELTIRNIQGYYIRKVTPFGTSAKVDCPKKHLGKRVFLIIAED